MLCRVLGKYLMYADSQETGITPHLALHGYWESWITLALARTLRPGWHCLDVGANHGYYTLVMADGAGPDGRVVPGRAHAATRRAPSPDARRQRVPDSGGRVEGGFRHGREDAAARHPGTSQPERPLSPRSPARRTKAVAVESVTDRLDDTRLAARRPDQDRRRRSGGERLGGDAADDLAATQDLVVDPRVQRRPLRRPSRIPAGRSRPRDSRCATSTSTQRSRT